MKDFGIQDHEIYKKRGRMNAQIGLLLAAFVVLVIIGTMAKLSPNLAGGVLAVVVSGAILILVLLGLIVMLSSRNKKARSTSGTVEKK